MRSTEQPYDPATVGPDYGRVFEASQNAYLLLTPDLTIVAASDGYLRLTRTHRSTLIGSELFSNYPRNPEDPTIDSAAQQIRDSFMHTGETRAFVALEPQRYDLARLESEGGGFEERWWQLTNTPILATDGTVEYIVQHVEDITQTMQLQRARAALQAHNEALTADVARHTHDLRTVTATLLTTNAALLDARVRLEATVAAAEVATWVWDIPGDRIIADRNLGRLFGLPAAEERVFPLATYLQFIHPDERERVGTVITEAMHSMDPYEMEYRIRRNDGTVRWVIARGRVERDEVGTPYRFPGVLLDITARKQAEAAREELLAREQLARAEAEAAVHARDVFLSIAAHELRTPVTALKGSVQLLQRRQARGTLAMDYLERSLTTLDKAATRLALLTDDLLDVSRIRTGQLPLLLAPVELGDLVTTLLNREREAHGDAHSLVLDLAPALPPIQADAARLEQVLTNLLDNAIKYSPAGGIVTVTVTLAEGGVHIGVRDAGIGLPAGSAEVIFTPFGRADNAVTHSLPGLGLGLYICRSIIERHGGRIWAESAGEECGTTITIWLPIVEAPITPRDVTG